MTGTMRLEVTEDGYIRNVGDETGDDIASMTRVERELREKTVDLSLGLFNKSPEYRIAKVWPRRRRQSALETELKRRCAISGYVTLLKFINGATPREMESILGFAPGVLKDGAEIALADGKPAKTAFAPRYTSQWPAGVPPIMVDKLGGAANPRFPAAQQPVYQWVIYRGQEIPGRKVAILTADSQRFRYP